MLSGDRPPEDDLVLADQRRRLARELHDIVTHHLANVALRSMSPADLVDAELRDVLGEVNDSATAALVELRLLATVLDDGPGTEAGQAVAALARDVFPSAAAARWRRDLDAAGFGAGYVVPPVADRLPRSTQSTVAQVLESTKAVVLQLGDRGSRCFATVDVGPSQVAVSVRVTPPGGLVAAPGHPELRALRARVDLTGGRLELGVGLSETRTARWRLLVVVASD